MHKPSTCITNIRYPDVCIRYPDTSGFLHRMSDHFCIVYVGAYCRIYVKCVLIMKDDGFTDEYIGWTCLPSTPEQSERFKFDVNIISIISSYMSRIMTKTVFRVSDQIRTNMAVHCLAAIRKVNGLKFRIWEVKDVAKQMRGNHIILKYVLIFVKIVKICM